jgi:polygalacturonase
MQAQDTRTVTEPSLPTTICSQLTAQLSATGNGMTLSNETTFDTTRINSALTTCTGKVVELSLGTGGNNAYLIAPITIPANTTLLVDAGVTVYGSRNPADYQTGSTTCGTVNSSGSGCNPLLTMKSNSSLMGYGAIDGRGYATLIVSGVTQTYSWWDQANTAQTESEDQSNPYLLNMNGVTGITLYKITLANSPMLHVHMDAVTSTTFWDVKVIAPYDARNTDGIDPGYSSNITITKSFLSEGDDNVAINGDNFPGATDISVTNNFFGDGHGASIGSGTQYGVSNVLWQNLTINGSAADSNKIGIRIKAQSSNGGLVNNITYKNICVENSYYAMVFNPFYGGTGSDIPQFQNITVQNFNDISEGKIQLQGYSTGTTNSISDELGLTLNNVNVTSAKSSDMTASSAAITLGPDPVNFASLITGTNVAVTNNVSTSNAYYSCPATVFTPLTAEVILPSSTITSSQQLTATVQLIVTKDMTYASWKTANASTPGTPLALYTPTGTISILNGSTVLGTATANGAGLYTITLPTLAAGTYALTASYSGDSTYPGAITFNASNASVLTVTGPPTPTVTLNSSSSSVQPGQAVTLTATVTGSGATPTGTVTFSATSTGATQGTLGTVTLNASGVATLSGLVWVGTDSITASYSGDSNYSAATSNAVTVVNAPVAGVLQLNWPFLNWAQAQTVGTTSSSWPVTVTNLTGVTVVTPTITVPSNFTYSAGTCTTSLSQGASCAFSVTFAPTTGSGLASGSLTVSASGYSASIPVSGIVNAAALTFNWPFLNFTPSGYVGASSSAWPVTLTNRTANTYASGATITPPTGFTVTSNTCTSSLAPAGTCTFNVTFVPTTAGTYNSTLTATAGTVTGSLTVQGVASPSITLNWPFLNFQPVLAGTTSPVWPVTITNHAPVAISSLVYGGLSGNGFSTSAGTCPTGASTLASGASCTFNVYASPSASTSASNLSATLTVSGTGTDSNTYSSAGISVTGRSNANGFSFNWPFLNFNEVAAGNSSSPWPVTLTNNNAVSVTPQISFTVPGYTLDTGCSTAVASGASCVVNVTFSPSSTGNYNGLMQVTGNSITTTLTVEGHS